MSAASMQGAANDHLAPPPRELQQLIRASLCVLLGGLLPVAAWITLAPLASAVVAPAFVKVDLNRRPVQHAEGGLVREVLVRDGQRVKRGEPLLVLGDVSVAADLNRLDYRVMAERASLARLEAEQGLASGIEFSGGVAEAAMRDPRLSALLAKERALFAARRQALVGQVALLRQQRLRVQQELTALRAQVERAVQSLGFQREELETHRRLLADGFVSGTRIAQLEGTVADYGVKLEERRSELARAEQRLIDTELRIGTLDGDYRQQASDQLKVTAARLSEIEQELRKSNDASARQVIVAPAAGEVIDLKFSSPGSVVPPRETIADIVPDDSRLLTEAHIRTEDVDRVRRGQPAEIRFAAFRYRTTRLVQGKVTYLSADRLVDRHTGLPYYSALIEADAASLAAAGDDLKLQAGMPAEVYITGETRTPLAYLLEPLTQVLRRGARER
ncbi:HlyD family secretion protein [Burkholderiales bacterium 8X]|nr:HlyD family secretion protein [Burkholderiales bacterium 8X]